MPVLFAEEFEPFAIEPQSFVPLFAATEGKGHFDKFCTTRTPRLKGETGDFAFAGSHMGRPMP